MMVSTIVICFMALLSYSSYNYISYQEVIRQHKFFYLFGLSLAIVSNLLWLYGVKSLNNKVHIFWLGITFDVIVTATSILIPVIFFDLRFNKVIWLGIGLILIGLFVIKEFGLEKA